MKTLFILAATAMLVVKASAIYTAPGLSVDQITLTSLSASDEKVMVLIHGWNRTDEFDSYNAEGWSDAIANLEDALHGTGWKLCLYHWEEEASTGGNFEYALFQGFVNGTAAAEHAEQLSQDLVDELTEKAPNLRRVHFVAHSAGSWMARFGMEKLLQQAPYVVGSVTLLDPFIPGADFGTQTNLTTNRMSELASISNQDRLYRLENYFAKDITDNMPYAFTNATSQEFSGWGNRDIKGLRVDYDPFGIGNYYGGHSGPVVFYGESATAARFPLAVPEGQERFPGGYTAYGFFKSLPYQEDSLPQISSGPTYSNGVISVTASGAGLSYQWFKNGSSTPIPNQISSSIPVVPPTIVADEYVVRVYRSSDLYSQTFSRKVRISPVSTPVPRIDSVSPLYITGKPAPQTTRITIAGSNYTSSTRLDFNDGVTPYTNRVPATWTSTQLTYDITTGQEASTWTVVAKNGTVESPPYTFYVIASTVAKQLVGLAIEGPSTVAEGGSAQFAARAYFSDNTNSIVSASWSENSSYASISSSGLLSASSVSSNREVTVTASYSSGGISKTATTVLTIVNSGSGGGTQVTDVIVNGGFEAGTTPWAPVGYAAVVALSYPHSGSRYAYLGDANNATGAMAQFVPIPATTTNAVLEFYINVSSNETTTTTAFDKMKIDFSTGSDQYVGTVATFSNLDKRTAGSYIKKSYDVTSLVDDYRGESLFLIFNATTDYADSTIFRIDDVKLNITTSTPVELLGLTIEGDSAVPENGFEAYVAKAVFSDGTTQTISPNSWSENSSVSTISSAGYFQTGSVSSTTTVTVSASYTFNGNTETATKAVTVFPRSNPPVFDRLAIEGPGSVDEGSYINLVAKAIYTDGSVQTVTPIWSENSSWASITTYGKLTAEEVSSDKTVTVSASISIGGVSKSASHQVLIVDGTVTPTFTSLEIVGPGSVNEGSAASYDAVAHFSDGSTDDVNPSWSENGSKTSISQYGLLSAGYVTANTPVTVTANHTIDGVQKTTTKTVTVVDLPDTTAPRLVVENPASGSVVNVSSIEVRGIATDSGFGYNGVTSVMVNGVAAAGGSTTLGNVASWSKTVTLAEGPNSITVRATDSLGNVATEMITLTYNVATPSAWGEKVEPLIMDVSGARHFGIRFDRPIGGGTEPTFIWGSSNLKDWSDVTSQMVMHGSPAPTGDGIRETVIFRCPLPINVPGGFQGGTEVLRFLRLSNVPPPTPNPIIKAEATSVNVLGQKHFAIRFARPVSGGSQTISIHASSDLAIWQDVTGQMVLEGSPIPTGDGLTETVIFRCPSPMGAPGGLSDSTKVMRFLRVGINETISGP